MATTAERDIFAIAGLPPEVLAVAMAKYSRSKESIRDTITELTEEKSAEFHEKWVLGYGDASVADMAIIAIACENVSILASKAVEDTRLAAFQEKSTRYVGFDATRYYRPPTVMEQHAALYEETIDALFAAYHDLAQSLSAYLRDRFPKPEDKTEKIYEAKLKARALDAVRYLLPVATLTNFGMIMSARSLRHLIAKLKGSAYAEIRDIAEAVQRAALEPAYNPRADRLTAALAVARASHDNGVAALAHELSVLSSLQIKGAPTLIKHTEPSSYESESRQYLDGVAKKLFHGLQPTAMPQVDFLPAHDYEDELVTTLLYPSTALPYRQMLDVVSALPDDRKAEIIRMVGANRGSHDQPRREYEIGGQFVFDVLMDYGAFRDLQRHRMCTQINQPLSTDHGYEVPFELEDAELVGPYQQAIEQARTVHEKLLRTVGHDADYLIPMAFRKRTLFKMDLRELYHMVELRSKPGGHMSYRRVVLDMYEAVKTRHPALVQDLRSVTPNYDEDFFKR